MDDKLLEYLIVTGEIDEFVEDEEEIIEVDEEEDE